MAIAIPEMDAESRPYWEGLAEERLRLQLCSSCGRHRFPAMPGCPSCGSEDSDWVDAQGGGRLYSWVTVHHSFSSEFSDATPYTIGTVELDEGCRMLARLSDSVTPKIDARLTICFVRHEGWTEARFEESST